MSKEEKEAKRKNGRNRYRNMKEKTSYNINFLYSIRMSKRTLKFDNNEVNKKECHASKQPIALDIVNVNQILISNKFKHNDTGFRYFIGCKDDDTIRPLCIILPQMSGYIKRFYNGEKNMSIMIEDYSVLVKYNDIWNKIKEMKAIKFHSNPVYDKKYIKAKVKIFNSVVNANFWCDEVRKKGVHYTCIACINIDSVRKMEKKNYRQVYLEECNYKIKEKNTVRFIDVELELDSGSDSEYFHLSAYWGCHSQNF